MHNAECHYAECRVLFTVMVSVIMLLVVMLSVVIVEYRYAECHGAIKTCAWIQHLLASKHQTRMELSVYYVEKKLYKTGSWVKPELKVKQLQKTIHVLRRL
jgi:hypothetical protein